MTSAVWLRLPDMTLDDQLSALAPLSSGVVASLAEYRNGSGQIRELRWRGRVIPAERLRTVARKLRELAQAAEGLAGPG